MNLPGMPFITGIVLEKEMTNRPCYRMELLRRELKRQENEKFREEVGQFVFGIFITFILLFALHLGFNVCMKFEGDCKNNPESLLFTPRK